MSALAKVGRNHVNPRRDQVGAKWVPTALMIGLL